MYIHTYMHQILQAYLDIFPGFILKCYTKPVSKILMKRSSITTYFFLIHSAIHPDKGKN